MMTLGEQRRDSVLACLESAKDAVLLRARRALITAALGKGEATADDVYPAVELLAGRDPRCLGAVAPPLVKAGIIRAAGYVKSTRPNRNASPIVRWELADAEAARRWLAENRDEPDRPEDENARQLTLPGVG
jgi:hypothetical protein